MTDRRSDKTWRHPAWQVLAWLSCALLLAGPGVPGLCPGTNPVQFAGSDAEKSDPVQDDDNSETGQNEASLPRRCQLRDARLAETGLAHAPAHLPHQHSSTPGHSLPVMTPFERGVNLPLRC